MILKTSTSKDGYALRIISDVKSILKNRTDKDEHIHIYLKNGEVDTLIISEKTDGAYQELYDWIFLMNDEGKTIEKIV